jgi:hypothetical protein
MKIIEGFIGKEDLLIVQDYLNTIVFHTKDEHVPLHDNLFDNGAPFDIHTRGEMPDHILEIFSKYSKGSYEIVQSENKDQYHPAMFSKHYIARYKPGSSDNPHHNEHTKPEGTYVSYIVWQNANSGGEFLFPKLDKQFLANPGDLIYFKDTEENMHGLSEITDGFLFLSESWMGKKGQLWMENRSTYEEVEWDDWEIKGFHD